jgi:hypothetical protein
MKRGCRKKSRIKENTKVFYLSIWKDELLFTKVKE